MINLFERTGQRTAISSDSSPFSAAQHDKTADRLAALRSSAARDDLTPYPDDVLLEAFQIALAHGGYQSASELCESLERRGSLVRTQRQYKKARAQLDVVCGVQVETRDGLMGLGGAWASPGHWLRRGRRIASAERWLSVHNVRVPSCPSDLRAFNYYLRHFSPLRAIHAGSAKSWFQGLAFSGAPCAETGPLVSVFVAARNAQATIEYAVDSVLQQTYANLEVLVCDDASSDDTRSVLVRRYGRDPRVRLYRSLAQQGPYNVKNALLLHAAGEFVTTHDADDLALPTRIGSQVGMARRPGMAGSITRWLRLREDGSVVFFADGKARRLCMASLLVRRELLQEIGGYPPARVGADLDVYGLLKSKVGPQAFETLDAPQVLGLWEAGSLTRTLGLEALETGYRSPLRRAYSERVFRRDVLGMNVEQDDPIQVFLLRTGNLLAPQGIESMR